MKFYHTVKFLCGSILFFLCVVGIAEYIFVVQHEKQTESDVRSTLLAKKQEDNKIKDEATDLLFKAILSLKNEEECYNFFEDLCTVPELKAMSQRIVVAKMLTDKKVYSDIVAKTGASTATISRVNRSLIYGSDGYEMVFGRIFDEKEDKVEDK